jgi:hypothetical protein
VDDGGFLATNRRGDVLLAGGFFKDVLVATSTRGDRRNDGGVVFLATNRGGDVLLAGGFFEYRGDRRSDGGVDRTTILSSSTVVSSSLSSSSLQRRLRARSISACNASIGVGGLLVLVSLLLF